MNSKLEQGFRQIIGKFYKKVLYEHSLRNSLAVRFNKFIDDLDEIDKIDDISLISLKVESKKEFDSQFQSLRSVHAISRKNLSSSPSKLSATKSKDQSKDRTDGEGKQFGCQWVYSSSNCQKILLFAIISSFILTDNKFSFKLLEDKINDYLSEHNTFSPIMMISITRQWQKIGNLLTKSKLVRWQRGLKDIIDKIPLQFALVVCEMMLGMNGQQIDMSSLVFTKLSKELKVSISSFYLNYRDIEKIERVGIHQTEIIIGKVKNQKLYVISNRLPEYSKKEGLARQIKEQMSANINLLLKQFNQDTDALRLDQLSNLMNEKEKLVKEFFLNKMQELQAD